MPRIKDLQQLSSEKNSENNKVALKEKDVVELEPPLAQTEYTDDGGIIIGKGWIQYYHEESGNNFYTHEEHGTQWDYPTELIEDEENPEKPENDDDGEQEEEEEVGETRLSMENKGGLTMSLFNEVNDEEGSDIEEIDLDNDGNQLKEVQDEDDNDLTDESDDEDLAARAFRLGGGFRTKPRPPTPPSPTDHELENEITLGESTAAMLEKLNGTRAATNGDVMSNQAAFKADGMLMLESIKNKGDPTSEEGDEEAIARLEGEKVRYAEEMEKIRSHFTDQEQFRLREEFNDVDADRSGFIDNEELKILLTILNDSKVPSEDEVRRIMLEADSSGDGQLDFLEFLALVKSLRDEKKADQSIIKSLRKFIDTVKTDLLGGILKDVEEYRERAYRYFNSAKIEKAEKREAEKARIRAEKEAEEAKAENDRMLLQEEEEQIEEKLKARDEDTGLETEVLYDGNDIDFPDETDVVTIHIKLIIFDPNKADPSTWEILENSRKRRQPFKFKCDGGAVIAGLALTVPKMSLGMKVRVICPPEFAYGEKGLPPKVPPNSTLVIEVELLSFETNDNVDNEII